MSLGISAGAWLAAGASVAGSLISSSAASDAASTQAGAANQASALSQAQYDQTRADNAGVRARGESAGNRLSYLMGLGGSASGGGNLTADQLRSELQGKYTTAGPSNADNWRMVAVPGSGASGADTWMPMQYGLSAPATIDETGLSTAIQERLAQQTAQQTAQQSDPSYGSLSRNFGAADMAGDPIYSQLAPGIRDSMARETGMMDRFSSFGGTSPETGIMNRRFGMSDFVRDPGYDFRMKEGAKGVENSAAARGGLLSGATLKAMERFGQDFASNEYSVASNRFNADRGYAADQYGNASNRFNTNRNFLAGQGDAAYNRYNNNNTTQYNRLAGVAGTGQQATNSVNSAGAANAQQIGGNTMDAANARAAAGIYGSRSLSNGLTNAFNSYQNNRLMSTPQPGITDDGYGIGQGPSYNGNYSRM